jgi:hypothetical protein
LHGSRRKGLRLPRGLPSGLTLEFTREGGA